MFLTGLSARKTAGKLISVLVLLYSNVENLQGIFFLDLFDNER